MAASGVDTVQVANGPINVQVATFVQTSMKIQNFRQRRYRVMFDDVNNDDGAENEKLFSRVIPLKSADGNSCRVRFMVELTKHGNVGIYIENCSPVKLEGVDVRFWCNERVHRFTNEVILPWRKLGFPLFLDMNFPLDEYIDQQGVLTINVKLKIAFMKTYDNKEEILGNMDNITSSLSKDIKDLRKRGEGFADVTILCQHRKFPTHKTILAARSDVFSVMFQHKDTIEAQTNQVHMEDTDPETVERFLRFVYGEPLSNLKFEEVTSLMMIADKYNAKGLIQICRTVILDLMTDTNVVHVAILGHQFNDDVLKESAMERMANSGKNIKEVEDSEILKSYPELSFDLLEYFSSVKN